MRYTKMRKMIQRMVAGALTAFLLTGLAGCGAAGPVGEEETDEQETGSSADAGEQGVSEADWDKIAFEINGEPVSLREWNFYLRMSNIWRTTGMICGLWRQMTAGLPWQMD